MHGPNGVSKLRMMVDTGSSYTVVDPKLLARMGFDPVAQPRSLTFASATQIVHAPVITVDGLSAFGITRRNFDVVGHALPPTVAVDGLLGLSFFRGRRLTIDFRTGRLGLR